MLKLNIVDKLGLITILYSIFTINYILSEKIRYDNYTIYKVIPKDKSELKILQDLRSGDVKYDFWSDLNPNSEFVNVMSSPEFRNILEGSLDLHNMTYKITVDNVQEAINNQTIRIYNRTTRVMAWDGFYTLDDIEAWMSDMARGYRSTTTEVIAGDSYEGRKIKGLKISHGPGKKAIFIESGMHPREWITMSTACFIIHELLTNRNQEVQEVAKEFDWYIFPVVNPDGYVWTHNESRMWRKNRRPIGTAAVGVDLNRNWNSSWLTVGSSTDPSTENYAGLNPFSEPETKALSDFIKSIKDIEMYVSLHAYSQLLLVPFGNTTEHLANYNDSVTIGRRAMGALAARYGTLYRTGNTAETIYQSSGNSGDWVKGTLNVPLVYCFELRDKGDYAFLLPPDQIHPNNQEVMDGLLELIHQGKRFGYFNAGFVSKASLLMMTLQFVVLKFLW